MRLVAAVSACLLAASAAAIDASNRYRSPRNPERKVRVSTDLIVLHTTEAPAKSSLNKVSDRGECHFVVTEEGSVYRIVDRDKEAFHAGRSMWMGREDVDRFSIGIECVGYHDKPMGPVQLAAIRTLVKELQSMYRLGDDRVVSHCHVAYGAPNKWHRFKHRGRKRCGMLFATPTVRAVLGLKSRPACDPDVKAKRLRNADDYLAKVLYGSVDPMRGAMKKPQSDATAASTGIFSWMRKAAPSAGPAASPVPRPPPKPSGSGAGPVPGSVAELKARGYRLRGRIAKGVTALSLVGKAWNSPDTFYTIRDKVIPGSRIDPKHIEVGMEVWSR